jgi:hypothetical protein
MLLLHPSRRSRVSAILALALLTLAPLPALAEPGPQVPTRRGFRLFAGAIAMLKANRVECAIKTYGAFGSICTQDQFYANSPGGVWPRGTIDQYLYSSGPQAVGIVGITDATHPWAGDTSGSFNFEEGIRPIYSWADAADAQDWPEAAKVPLGDPSEALYHRLLRGRKAASQGDMWWMSWEGNPEFSGGDSLHARAGLAIEYRMLTWNYPPGNEDILYLLMTLYNVTSLDPAAYAGVRPAMREILLEQAQRFHDLNQRKFHIALPHDGWELKDVYVAYFVDPDVGAAGVNYASVNLPFAMGFAYQHDFGQPPGWTFSPSIFSPPFFPGVGFVGAKYLKSPVDPLTGQDIGIRLFSTFVNPGSGIPGLTDPQNIQQLYRLMKGTLNPALGDGQCNSGNTATTHLCYINNIAPADMRLFQSSGPLQLKPGEQSSIVVALIFAAPLPSGSCGLTCSIKPGNAAVWLDPATASQANAVDTMTGFRRYLGDLNGNGNVDQEEIDAAPGSLLGKAKLAQAVFDSQFLLPFAPESPEFFLIPGDNEVTVIWKPSPTEVSGDPFFDDANRASINGAPNPLYDPNYRRFDVEGYRVYRGRVDAPNELALIAQFDYQGTVISDYTGVVNTTDTCAPEYGLFTGCAGPVAPNLKDGTTLTDHVDHELAGEITQVRAGSGRTPLANGTQVYILAADTAPNGGGTGGTCGPRSTCPQLGNTGVPFVYVDRDVRSHFRYFYSVTAFDVNSLESGPASLESARVTDSVTPTRQATNYENSAQVTAGPIGRGSVLDSAGRIPALDRSTGEFSGPFPPADGATLGFAGGLVTEVIAGGLDSLEVILDSIHMGSADLSECCANGQAGVPTDYFWSATAGGSKVSFMIPMEVGPPQGSTASAPFPGILLDNSAVARYGGSGPYRLQGELSLKAPSLGYLGEPMLAAALDYPGFREEDLAALGATAARYNGARWFDGPSPAKGEVTANPINACGDGRTGQCAVAGSFENAGKLAGVATVYQPLAYTMYNREWRNFSAAVTGVRRAADYNLHWGTGGTIDSVVDVTHNVLVPFQDSVVSGGWGVLNTVATGPGSHDGRDAVLTPSDWYCVEPFNTMLPGVDAWFPCSDASRFILSDSAIPGPIAFGAGDNNAATPGPQDVRNPANLAANPGFSLYLAGTVTFFELAGGQLPAAGTVWSLRDYTGLIAGGNGIGGSGNVGPYTFVAATRPFTAIGAGIRMRFSVVNHLVASRRRDLAAVHTVPDPYYVTNVYEQTTDVKVLKFVNLPQQAIIRIYSSSGILVTVLEHNSGAYGGEETWNLLNRNGLVVASGVYFYHIEAGDARRVGRFTVVNWAQ